MPLRGVGLHGSSGGVHLFCMEIHVRCTRGAAPCTRSRPPRHRMILRYDMFLLFSATVHARNMCFLLSSLFHRTWSTTRPSGKSSKVPMHRHVHVQQFVSKICVPSSTYHLKRIRSWKSFTSTSAYATHTPPFSTGIRRWSVRTRLHQASSPPGNNFIQITQAVVPWASPSSLCHLCFQNVLSFLETHVHLWPCTETRPYSTLVCP
jgi:hypothetical protein